MMSWDNIITMILFGFTKRRRLNYCPALSESWFSLLKSIQTLTQLARPAGPSRRAEAPVTSRSLLTRRSAATWAPITLPHRWEERIWHMKKWSVSWECVRECERDVLCVTEALASVCGRFSGPCFHPLFCCSGFCANSDKQIACCTDMAVASILSQRGGRREEKGDLNKGKHDWEGGRE